MLITGKIFLNPEMSDQVVAFQMYTDPQNDNGNTIVAAPAATKVKDGDYVRVTGTLVQMFSGTNAFGGVVQAPMVKANSVEVVSRDDVIAPTIKQYTVNKAVNQNGLIITLSRVELAKQETRFYFTVQNQSKQKATIFADEAKLVQGSRQLEPKDLFDSGYPSLPSDMLPGVKADTVIVYDAVDPSQPMHVVWDGPQLEDYSIDFKPYEWTVGP